jgi:hypothetical protein
MRKTEDAAKWVLRPAIPPGRLTLPLIDTKSAYFRLWNTHAQGYLAEEQSYKPQRSYSNKESYMVQSQRGAHAETGTVYRNSLFPDPPHRAFQTEFLLDRYRGEIVNGHLTFGADGGPEVKRTSIRRENPEDLGIIFDLYGKPIPGREQQQQQNFLNTCWLIRDWTPTAPLKPFPELDDAALDQWEQERQKTLSKN